MNVQRDFCPGNTSVKINSSPRTNFSDTGTVLSDRRSNIPQLPRGYLGPEVLKLVRNPGSHQTISTLHFP